MSDPNRLPPNSSSNNPNSRGNDEAPPFVFRSEFEAFTTHYNENMEKALETTSDMQFIVSRLLARVISLRKLWLVLIIWNLTLTVMMALIGWRILS